MQHLLACHVLQTMCSYLSRGFFRPGCPVGMSWPVSFSLCPAQCLQVMAEELQQGALLHLPCRHVTRPQVFLPGPAPASQRDMNSSSCRKQRGAIQASCWNFFLRSCVLSSQLTFVFLLFSAAAGRAALPRSISACSSLQAKANSELQQKARDLRAISRQGTATETCSASRLTGPVHVVSLQAMADRGLQKEAQERLQGFMQQLRGSQAADLSGKRLQDEGLCYICEAIAFNDRWARGVGAGLAAVRVAVARLRQQSSWWL